MKYKIVKYIEFPNGVTKKELNKLMDQGYAVTSALWPNFRNYLIKKDKKYFSTYFEEKGRKYCDHQQDYIGYQDIFIKKGLK